MKRLIVILLLQLFLPTVLFAGGGMSVIQKGDDPWIGRHGNEMTDGGRGYDGINVATHETVKGIQRSSSETVGSKYYGIYPIGDGDSLIQGAVSIGSDAASEDYTHDPFPNSALQVHGPISTHIRNLTNPSCVILASDSTVIADCDVTLPTAVGIEGRIYIIKRNLATPIDIHTYSNETIDTATSETINTNLESRTIQSDNANWWIIGDFD